MITWPSRKLQAGGTTLGILIGIVIGLAIAVVTALFVTRTSLPFIGPAAKSGDKPGAGAPPTAAVPEAPKPQVPVAAGALPDPNRTAASKPRAAPGTAPMERRDIPTVTANPAPEAQPAQAAQAAQAAQVAPTAAPGSPAPPAGSGQAPIRAATPTVPGPVAGNAPAPQAAAAASDKGATYLLQAGAFRGCLLYTSDAADEL